MWRVAIIDDDDSIRALLSRVLQKKFNCLVFEASNGLDGIALLKKEKPHLTFLDITMPVMNGLETLKVLRASDDVKDLPVMILSSVNDKHVISHLLAAGITGYMLKPLEIHNVIERLSGFFTSLKKTQEDFIHNRASENNHRDTVLIVDGDLRFRSVLHVLYRTDFNLLETESGMEALSLILQKEIKNVIIGERIQVINPVTLAQKIKSASKTKVQVYLATEHPERFDLTRLPFDNILTKSYMPEAVKKELTAKVFGRPDIRFGIVSVVSQKMKDDLKKEFTDAIEDSFSERVTPNESFQKEDIVSVITKTSVIDTPINIFISVNAPTLNLDPVSKASLKTKMNAVLGIITVDIITYFAGLSVSCTEPEEMATGPEAQNLLECNYTLPTSGPLQIAVKII